MGTNQRSQIVMSQAEIDELVAASRTATLATIGSTGRPHLVAMWFAVVGGEICFETKAKSQKAVNLRRDPRVSCLIEDGTVYEQLRGVSFEGTAEISDDPDFLWKIGVSMVERYYGPYSEDMKPFVETMLHKRVGVRLKVERVRSWDHSKLGLPPTGEPGGTTATAPRRPR
jgi:PPOX class probable F420-dependent enzyme